MPESLRESVGRIADPGNLDSTVEEVFTLVLGSTCNRVPGMIVNEEESLMAVVGFGGILSGACVLRCGSGTALAMAEKMMGVSFTELDSTVQDAIGELCNMLAGGWKSRIPELSSHCGLSVPAIVTGRDYQMRVHPLQFQLSQSYCFDDLFFEVKILCEGLQ